MDGSLIAMLFLATLFLWVLALIEPTTKFQKFGVTCLVFSIWYFLFFW